MIEPTEAEVKAAAAAMQRLPWTGGPDAQYYGERARAALSAAYAIRDDKLAAAEKEIVRLTVERVEAEEEFPDSTSGWLAACWEVTRLRGALEATEALLRQSLDQEIATADKLAAAEAVVEAAQTLVDMIYPAAVFDGSSGDPGALAVVAVRAALANYRKSTDA